MTDKLPPNLLALFAPRPQLPYSKPLDRDPAKRKGPTITGVGQFISLLKDYDPNYVPTETVEEKKKRKIRIVKNKESGKPRGYAFIEFEREKDMKAAYKDADGVKLLGRRILVDVERGRTVKGWRPRRLGGGLGGTRIGGPEQNQKYSGREGAYAVHAGHPSANSGYDKDYRSSYSSSRGVVPSSSSSAGYGYSGSNGKYGGRHSSGGYGGSSGYDRDYRRRRSRSRSPRRDDRYSRDRRRDRR
ncbi:16511_t:CDS:2 [Acaulospora colombiana]|uniref:16511_t:CDS:1 n=1 Tax=Acaulospora colombiana TaxID=27376 RepID=A0ACA9KQX6_9GLOM|nr:16511_t:CDS:2 [Acaulospora colombiana]